MSSRADLPEVVRIKRKRNQDSLQALSECMALFEDRR